MCDTGRFAFERYNGDGRLEGGAHPRRPRYQVGTPVPNTLSAATDALTVRGRPDNRRVSPWITVEEGELVKDLATALGVDAVLRLPGA